MIPELIFSTICFWGIVYLIVVLRNKATKKKLSKVKPMDVKPMDAAELDVPAESKPKLEMSANDILKKLEA